MQNIRNFCIIAHIDHGKSTLADRLLEITGTVEKRKMKEQLLDQMELERERGITIKMAPVRMMYHSYGSHPERSEGSRDPSSRQGRIQDDNKKQEFILNLIDTPGHSDFSYEVSRALQAVEGAILLVDATQGIQAQTLANFRVAKNANLKIIGAVNKIDLHPEKIDDLVLEIAELLDCGTDEIHRVSGKTGEGVEGLLQAVIEKIPPPSHSHSELARALIFDSFYDNHKGIIASVRVFDGSLTEGEEISFMAVGEKMKLKEVGIFTPQLKTAHELGEGEIGYIATGIKDPDKVKIGDTVIRAIRDSSVSIRNVALPGYKEPKPVVFISFYPEDADEHKELERALKKLRLNDSSITIDPDTNEVLGKGFKVGFLGKLHFEIVAERLKREFDIRVVTTFPTVAYEIKTKGEWRTIIDPSDLPPEYEAIKEPMVRTEIIMAGKDVKDFFALQNKFRIENVETETAGERVLLKADMPLAELMSDFDDNLKSVSGGYASFSYELIESKPADIVRVEFLVAGEKIPGLSRFFHKSAFEYDARKMVKRLKELLPRQQFTQAIQAEAQGRVIAREDITALKKNVTGHLYGGDRTRKMKLWKKQQKGKKRLKERAHVQISPEIFRELLKK
ncbi:MAG: translation elongation factor 4 [bacterium]|nr:translation elongation factor 4 [bacterium]